MNTNIDRKLDKHIELIGRYARVALTKIMKPAKYSLNDLIQEGVLAFLYAEKQFDKDRGVLFRTYLINCLRNHFTNLVKHSYRGKKMDSLSSWGNLLDGELSSELDSTSRKNAIPDTLEIVQVSFLIRSFNEDELEYVNAILSLKHKPRRSRRKTARKELGISYEREVELRNSIRDKIRK